MGCNRRGRRDARAHDTGSGVCRRATVPVPEERLNKYFELANERYQADDIKGAIAYTKLALDIQKRSDLYYNLARLYEKSREYTLALSYYQMSMIGETTDDALRQKTRTAIERVEKLAALGRLVFKLEPASADVSIGTNKVQLDADGGFDLPAGTHRYTVGAKGYEPHSDAAEIARGGTTNVVIKLRPVMGNVAPKPKPGPKPTSEPRDESDGIGAGPIALISIGAALAGVGIVTFVVGEGSHGRLADVQDDALAHGGIAASTRRSAIELSEEGTLLKTIGVIGMLSGAAVLTLGTVLAISSGDDGKTGAHVIGGPVRSASASRDLLSPEVVVPGLFAVVPCDGPAVDAIAYGCQLDGRINLASTYRAYFGTIICALVMLAACEGPNVDDIRYPCSVIDGQGVDDECGEGFRCDFALPRWLGPVNRRALTSRRWRGKRRRGWSHRVERGGDSRRRDRFGTTRPRARLSRHHRRREWRGR